MKDRPSTLSGVIEISATGVPWGKALAVFSTHPGSVASVPATFAKLGEELERWGIRSSVFRSPRYCCFRYRLR